MAGESKLGTAQVAVRATLDELDKDLNNVRGRVAGALKGVGDLGKIALGGLALGAVAVGGAIATIGPAAVEAASDLNESVSKANVVFGDSIKVIDQFAKMSASSFGISKQAAYEATGTFGNLFTAMGLAKGPASDMSVDIVKLAADLASFNNLDPAQVLDKLRAGLVGETEPLRSLGVNLTADAIKAKAFEMGLAKTTSKTVIAAGASEKLAIAQAKHSQVLKKYGASSLQARQSALSLAAAQAVANGKVVSSSEELTPAMKAQAAYALIMEQTRTAQGDFARTSDGLANTQRILSATFKDISADIGTALLPGVLAVVQTVQPIVKALMPKLTEFLTKLSPVIEDVGNSVGIFVERLIETGNPIEALSGALVNFPGIKGTFDGMVSGLTKAWAAIKPVRDAIGGLVTQLSAKLSPVINNVKNVIGTFVSVLITTGNPLQAVSAALANFPDLRDKFYNLVDGLQKAWAATAPLRDAIGKLFEGIRTGNFQPFLDSLTVLKDMVWNWLTGPGGALSQAGTQIGVLVGKIGEAVTTNWPIISGKLLEWGAKFWDWLTAPGGAIDTAVTKLDALVVKFTEWVGSAETKKSLEGIGSTLGGNLVTGVVAVGAAGETQSRFAALMVSLLALINNILKAQATAISAIGGSLASGLLDGIVNTIKTQGPEKVKQALLDMMGPAFMAGIFSTQGKANIGGAVQGINNFAGKLQPGYPAGANLTPTQSPAIQPGTAGPAAGGTTLNFQPVFNGMTEANRAWYTQEARRQAELVLTQALAEVP